MTNRKKISIVLDQSEYYILMVIVLIILATSLVFQLLRLWASTAMGLGSIPGQGTVIPHAMQCGQIEKTNKQTNTWKSQTNKQNLRRLGINQTTRHVWENHKTCFSNFCTFPHSWFSDNVRVLQELNET